LKKRYLNELATLKEMFPDWADVDLVLALEESDGDLPTTIDKITEGKNLAILLKASDAHCYTTTPTLCRAFN
jgi:hypothetical protein